MTDAVKTPLPIGSALKSIRLSKCLSQRAAGREIGCSYVHLNNIENDYTSPTVRFLEKVFEAWGIDVYLLAAKSVGRKCRQNREGA